MAARWYAAVCGAAHDAVLNAWQVSRAGTWAGTAQHGDIRATDMVALALSAFDQARQLAPRMPKIAFLRADLFMALNRYEVGGWVGGTRVEARAVLPGLATSDVALRLNRCIVRALCFFRRRCKSCCSPASLSRRKPMSTVCFPTCIGVWAASRRRSGLWP